MALSEQNHICTMSDEEDDLELLRIAALQTLKNSECKSNAPIHKPPRINILKQNKFSMASKRGRGFYISGSMRGGNHRNGQMNRNTNLISIPTMEPTNLPQTKLILPQDRYSNKVDDNFTKKEDSKFSRYVDHSEESDSDNSENEMSESENKLKRSSSLDALMQELEYEISGEKPPIQTKSNVKKTQQESKDESEQDDKNKVKDLNEKIELQTSIVSETNDSDSKELPIDKKIKKIENDSKEINFKIKSGSVPQRKGLLPKPQSFTNHQPHTNTTSYNNHVAYSYSKNAFPSQYNNQYTNDVPYIPTKSFPPKNNFASVTGTYNPPVINNVIRPLSPLTLNTDALCTIAMAPLSPRSAAFVWQNRKIIEKRKRSPRKSYSRSPSPNGRQRDSKSPSPRRIQSRRNQPANYSPPRRNSRSPRRNDINPLRDSSPKNRLQNNSNLRRNSLSPKMRIHSSPDTRIRRISPENSRKKLVSPDRSLKRSKVSPKWNNDNTRRTSPINNFNNRRHSPINIKRKNSPKNKNSPTRRTSPINSSKKICPVDHRKRSVSPIEEIDNDSSKDNEDADPILEARKKKFEQPTITNNEGVIRLKPIENTDNQSDTPDEEQTIEDCSNEEEDTLVLDDTDIKLDDFSDEESDDENEGRFKSKSTEKPSEAALRFSLVVNGSNSDIKNKSLDDTCLERNSNKDRRDLRYRDRVRNMRIHRDVIRSYRNVNFRKDERREDGGRWPRDIDKKDDRREERTERRDDRRKDRSDRKEQRSERKDDRKAPIKSRLTLKKEEEKKEDVENTSSIPGKRSEELKRKLPKVDDVEWLSGEPKQIKTKEKPVVARKVAIANVEKDDDKYQQDVICTVINKPEQELTKKNDGGDLRAQLSRKRAERQSNKPTVTTEDVQSRLLHNALGAVFQKKIKRTEVEAAPKEKLSIHQRLGLTDEHSNKKKSNKRTTEQV